MSKTGRKEVIKILRRRDGLSEKEAEKLINECVKALESGNYEAIQDYLGLEDDYIFDILGQIVAAMTEQADVGDLKSSDRNIVWVQIPLAALFLTFCCGSNVENN